MLGVIVKPEVLRKAAALRNLSLGDLAKLIGVGPNYFYVMLSGRHQISPKLRRRILDNLELEFDDLFTLVESK